MNKFRNNILSFFASCPLFFGLNRALGEVEIDMIDLEHENIPEMEPEMMPDLPQIQEVENNVAQSATAFFNEHTLLAIIAILVIVLLVVFGVILFLAKGKRTPVSSANKTTDTVLKDDAKNTKDIASAVKSFLIRTEIIR
ncbi:hypothetical protein IKQ26_02440 [bacterium]|nr:hypothetical protein [bacterium]